jgi:hypothetical protein
METLLQRNTLPNNESGLYTGISIKPVNGITLNAYADVYSFPWLKFRTDGISYGKDFLVLLMYQPNKQLKFIPAIDMKASNQMKH